MLDRLLNNFLSKKLQIVILSTVLFLATDKFSAEYLSLIYAAYMGLNVLQKFAQMKGRENGTVTPAAE